MFQFSDFITLTTYQDSGVNIRAGDELVRDLKEKVRSTYSSRVLSDLGGFGAFFDASFPEMKSPVLVSSTDGVGTKLKIAFATGRHDTIGQDLVNHCVNDIAVCGAKPLFFLDYLAVGKLRGEIAGAVLDGMVKACRENSCSLVGGETAEMPDFYSEGEYDLAGTVVGLVDRSRIVNGAAVLAGDIMIGIPSTGLHTNGYTLARKVLLEKYTLYDSLPGFEGTFGDVLLTVHRSYLNLIQSLMNVSSVHGFAHVTGGGIEGNTRRLLAAGLSLAIDWNSWTRPGIFTLIQEAGGVPESDMRRTFNLGIGLVCIVSRSEADATLKHIEDMGEQGMVVGEIISIAA